MQYFSVFILGMASLVAAAPEPQVSNINQLLGHARLNGQEKYPLYRTGGCISSMGALNGADYVTGARCRFYRDQGCNNQIGGSDGLPGQGRGNIMNIETYGSVTCWIG